jgi:hypothetical protein
VELMANAVRTNGSETSSQFHQNRHIEFRVVFLHILGSVLLPIFVDHRFQLFDICDGNGSELRFRITGRNANLR